jgi:hypothetical protein
MMGFLTGGMPGGTGGGIQQLLDQLRNKNGGSSGKNGKGAATQPPPMNPNVPQATGSFYQRMDPAARQQLLAAMMQRSRMGRNVGGV